jgi:AmmeMemoRadiSam system protein B
MEKSKVRASVVAGQFYPETAAQLKKTIDALVDKKAARCDAIACLLPHAGYMYSGRVAGETVSHLNLKDKIVLLGPNHTGSGARFSVMAEGIWQTPLGEVKIDAALAKKILESCPYFAADDEAHSGEHSLEVELPFLQYFNNGFEIVPVAFLTDDVAKLKACGQGIAAAIAQLGLKNSTLLVASSDMTHYEPQKQAQAKDRAAIEAILELDEDKLAARVRQMEISMCGYAPAIAMIAAAKALGAKSAKLVKYQTSGDVTGDKSSVVGYAGIILT